MSTFQLKIKNIRVFGAEDSMSSLHFRKHKHANIGMVTAHVQAADICQTIVLEYAVGVESVQTSEHLSDNCSRMRCRSPFKPANALSKQL